jgi:hypothetical protein
MGKLATDTPDCFMLWYMADGSTISSCRLNWREVEWEKVVKIELHKGGPIFSISATVDPTFKGFMHFRYGGCANGREVDSWVIGWTDGIECYLFEVDVRLGLVLQDFKQPLKELLAHLHPRLRQIIFNDTGAIDY